MWTADPENSPDHEDLNRLAPFIITVADDWHHPESNMSIHAFAALILATLHLESRYRREHPESNIFWNQIGALKDTAGDIGQRFLRANSSLGWANIRPSVVDEILGTLVDKPVIPLRGDGTRDFFDEGLLDTREEEWSSFGLNDHWERQKFLENEKNAIVILAANFNRGFERLYRQREDPQLSLYQQDWQPTVFNMLAWANQGIAESYTLSTDPDEKAELARKHASRGVAFVSAIIANRSFGLSIDSDDLVMFNDDDLAAYLRLNT